MGKTNGQETHDATDSPHPDTFSSELSAADLVFSCGWDKLKSGSNSRRQKRTWHMPFAGSPARAPLPAFREEFSVTETDPGPLPDIKKPKVVFLSDVGLLATFVTMGSWFLSFYSFMVAKPVWKQTICAILSIASSVFLATVGRKAMGGGWPVKRGQQIGVTLWQVFWVTLLFIAFGCFSVFFLR